MAPTLQPCQVKEPHLRVEYRQFKPFPSRRRGEIAHEADFRWQPLAGSRPQPKPTGRISPAGGQSRGKPTMKTSNNKAVPPIQPSPENERPMGCEFLSGHQVVMIDEALRMIGEYGEVRLIVAKGKLRFVVTQTSHDALKWEYGQIVLPDE
jgi:hypothetical protein